MMMAVMAMTVMLVKYSGVHVSSKASSKFIHALCMNREYTCGCGSHASTCVCAGSDATDDDDMSGKVHAHTAMEHRQAGTGSLPSHDSPVPCHLGPPRLAPPPGMAAWTPRKSTTSIVSIAGSSLTSHENHQEKGPYIRTPIALLGAPNRTHT